MYLLGIFTFLLGFYLLFKIILTLLLVYRIAMCLDMNLPLKLQVLYMNAFIEKF